MKLGNTLRAAGAAALFLALSPPVAAQTDDPAAPDLAAGVQHVVGWLGDTLAEGSAASREPPPPPKLGDGAVGRAFQWLSRSWAEGEGTVEDLPAEPVASQTAPAAPEAFRAAAPLLQPVTAEGEPLRLDTPRAAAPSTGQAGLLVPVSSP